MPDYLKGWGKGSARSLGDDGVTGVSGAWWGQIGEGSAISLTDWVGGAKGCASLFRERVGGMKGVSVHSGV